MRISVFGVSHPNLFAILPSIEIENARCQCCDESAGWHLLFRWACWGFGVGIAFSDDSGLY